MVRDSPRRSEVPSVLADVVPPLVVLVVLVSGWQWFVTTSDVPRVLVPSPLDVVRAGMSTAPMLVGAAGVTALTAGAGLFAGVLVGLWLAFLMTYSSTAALVIQPFVVGLRIAPVIALAPLVFLLFGDGVLARAAIVATMTTFPVAIGSLDGLRSVPRAYTDLLASVDAPAWRVFVHVRLPAATPSVLAGVKLAAALSVIGAVVTEFLTLDAGLGYRVFHASTALRTARTFAALAALALLGFGFYLVPAMFERWLRWD